MGNKLGPFVQTDQKKTRTRTRGEIQSAFLWDRHVGKEHDVILPLVPVKVEAAWADYGAGLVHVVHLDDAVEVAEPLVPPRRLQAAAWIWKGINK